MRSIADGELWQKLARELGFHLYGWTHARPFHHYRTYLEERFAAGRATPGERSDLDQRLDPARLLPGARSIWSVALSYLSESPSPSGPAKLARFTWGKDYHVVLGERLSELVLKWKSVRGDFSHRVCVDTSPILDRAVASRAGLGWTGKNTCLINPRYGSWLVLGSVITDLPVPPGKPGEGTMRPSLWGLDPCRSCTLCLDACLAGALEPYRLSGPRCLSHITQSRKDPPMRSASLMKTSLWGCDRCQEACPWNQGVAAPSLPEFRARGAHRAYPDPRRLAAMDDREFADLYGDSALAWRGPGILRRNARIFLGKSGDPGTSARG